MTSPSSLARPGGQQPPPGQAHREPAGHPPPRGQAAAMDPVDAGGPDIAEFPAVDRAPDPAALIEWMDDARTLPGVRIAKSLAVQALGLRPGLAVAEIGCGPGEDAREMARRVAPGGSVTGVDASAAMIAEARSRAATRNLPVTFRAGDALSLPLPDKSVDRCRADTLLQHVPDPARAVAEMARITRRGGRIALVEFDLGTLAVDHPDRATTRQVLDAGIDAAADGWAGRGLRRLLTAAGFADITLDARFVEADYPFLRRLLTPSLRRLTTSGAVPAEVLDRWQQALTATWDAGHYTSGAVIFTAAARLP
jgi:SAM-dependent methyltransferase